MKESKKTEFNIKDRNEFVASAGMLQTEIFTLHAIKESKTLSLELLRSEGYLFIQRLYMAIGSRGFLDGVKDGIDRIITDRKLIELEEREQVEREK